MSNRYKITAEEVDPSTVDGSFHGINLDDKDRIEQKTTIATENDFFGHPGEASAFWSHIKRELSELFAPFRRPREQINFGIFAGVITFFSLPFIRRILFLFKEPLVRGWRLEAVRRVALQEEYFIPSVSPEKWFKYFFKGLVLIVMRGIYFLPVFIVSIFNLKQMFELAKEIVYYVMESISLSDTPSLAEFIGEKVLPQVSIDIVFQLVIMGLYTVFVWPVYRIIMVQYALKLTRGWDFLNPVVVKKSIGIFKRNATSVYGIYGFTVAVDVFISWTGRIVRYTPLGWLLFWLMPTYYLLLRHWVKGYAYGLLGQELIKKGELVPKGKTNQDILDDNAFV